MVINVGIFLAVFIREFISHLQQVPQIDVVLNFVHS